MTRPGDWAAYWERPNGGPSASLADLPPATRAVLDQPWRELANALPRKARLLDLATGGGIVLEQLRAVRPDLRLIGVDAAPRLPVRAGMELRGGVDIAALPFPDGRFGAVTSRFGLEYASVPETAATEAARVLDPGGKIVFVLHHAQSPIVRHNAGRLAALRWAAIDSLWLDKAMNYARTRQMATLPVPPALRTAPAEANRLFPGQSAAWEVLTGTLQLLDLTSGPASVTGLADLRERALHEIGRIEDLMSAARTADDIAVIPAALGEAGVVAEAVRTLDEAGGAPLAWLLRGAKA